MVEFNFNNVIAEGSATINPATGETSQVCTVVTEMTGLVIGTKLLTDLVTFTVDSSLSITEAWINIRDVQAPQWVEDNYTEV
jgi:hypothetical protein